MTNLDSIFKSKDITLPTKVRLVPFNLIFPKAKASWTIYCPSFTLSRIPSKSRRSFLSLSWQNRHLRYIPPPGSRAPGMGKQWKQCQTLFFRAPKSLQMVIAAMKLLLGRKVMTNPDSIFKSRDITLPTKVHIVKVMFFPVVMFGCEGCTIKKAEHLRIDAFELWC